MNTQKQPPEGLTHTIDVVAFLFVQNPHLTGVENITKGRTSEELITLVNYCTEALENFSVEQLKPFDAYPWESVLEESWDQERAEELGMSVTEFRKNWNLVYQTLKSNLHDALLEEAFTRMIRATAPPPSM